MEESNAVASNTTSEGSCMQVTIPMLYNKCSINHPTGEEFILNCTSGNMTIYNLPHKLPTPSQTRPQFPLKSDLSRVLSIWKEKGIKQQMVEVLKEQAHFRLIKSHQNRDTFTLWGILQLLKLYPGRLPDLDLMFQCDDITLIKGEKYIGENSSFAPPFFHYILRRVNVQPWPQLANDLKEGSSLKNWTTRKPFAFWKGNVHNGINRNKLVDCASAKDWNAEIVHQNIHDDLQQLRCKIFIEGDAWSISSKYILACDSMTLLVEPDYDDFFTRGLIPLKHYWPINLKNLCKSIKFAVEWGNNNTDKVSNIMAFPNTMYVLLTHTLHVILEYSYSTM
ncbi:hypothetical protein Cgig2_033405 [Carnegiea gigantea]|uniref:Glycosyl transferase CAP10 domain-containing protein n=1 Tax=Carnegiea gigantea TaxID=171969 RepID=A0A9Q1QQQ4_9CARY|nr:hypothetical protein Cgig2_033405 [Carnegiea gigantea]